MRAPVQTSAGERGFDPQDPRIVAPRRLGALESVTARITMAVHLGLLRPGEMLPDNDTLAEAFGVGAATVRRGLVLLAEHGVLERVRGRGGGTRVTTTPAEPTTASLEHLRSSRGEAVALIDRRLVLEAGLVRLACERRDDAGLDALDALADEMATTTSWADFHRLDADFHQQVADAAQAPGARELYGEVLTSLYRFYLPYGIDHLHASNDEHRRLVDRLRHRDADGAQAVVDAHVGSLYESMFFAIDT